MEDKRIGGNIMTDKQEKPACEQFKELRDAFMDLFIAICEGMGIDKLLDWLTKRIEK